MASVRGGIWGPLAPPVSLSPPWLGLAAACSWERGGPLLLETGPPEISLFINEAKAFITPSSLSRPLFPPSINRKMVLGFFFLPHPIASWSSELCVSGCAPWGTGLILQGSGSRRGAGRWRSSPRPNTGLLPRCHRATVQSRPVYQTTVPRRGGGAAPVCRTRLPSRPRCCI